MSHDEVAASFAEWLAAHDAWIEAVRRLHHAVQIGAQMGGLPPRRLEDEVRRKKEAADVLLKAAEDALRRSKTRPAPRR
jgi:hypothetical protein